MMTKRAGQHRQQASLLVTKFPTERLTASEERIVAILGRGASVPLDDVAVEVGEDELHPALRRLIARGDLYVIAIAYRGASN